MQRNDRMEAVLEHLLGQIALLVKEKGHIVAAFDGRCAAGKTTLTSLLEKKISCEVIHMDDFFLQPGQRTKERLAMPGGNVDYERFLKEVMLPFKAGQDVSYTPYDCHSQRFRTPVQMERNKVVIIEGAYACHPRLWDYYDLHVFFDIDAKKQMERIVLRNGSEDAVRFAERWIPLEETYISAFHIKERCELYYQM